MEVFVLLLRVGFHEIFDDVEDVQEFVLVLEVQNCRPILLQIILLRISHCLEFYYHFERVRRGRESIDQ